MSAWNYINQLNDRLRGAMRVLVAFDVTKATLTSTTPLTDFGNIPQGGIQPSSEKFEDKSSTPEGNITESIDYIENKTLLTPQVTDLGREAVKAVLRAKDGTAIAQAALTDEPINDLDFSVTAAEVGKWYPLIRTSNSFRVYRVTSVVLLETGQTALVEGTDYVLDKAQGKVRFLSAINVDLDANTVTATGFNVTPLELDRQTALKAYVEVELWCKSYSLTEPRAVVRADTLVDSDEAITLTQGENASPTVNMISVGAPEWIDYADATAS